MLQTGSLFESLSVTDNSRLQMYLAGKTDPAWLDRLLGHVGLSARRGSVSGQLSGGENARAGLAIALAAAPALLLADEPTGEVDGETEGRIFDLLDHERAGGLAALIATHSPALAARATRVVYIDDGRISSGPTQAIPLIEAADVSRRFTQGGQTIDALLPALFQVWPCDRIALIGPSGCGKSTLLQLMADLDQPSSGALSWPGLGASGTLRPSRIGMVFQVPSLLPMLSVIENIELPMRLAGAGSESRARAVTALGAVGLAGLEDKLPDELSGGQAQRVGIARALAPRPPLLLADEPTGQLDRATAKTVLDIMLETLRGTQTALVVATHDPTVAARLDVVWTMSYGRLAIPAPVARPELLSQ